MNTYVSKIGVCNHINELKEKLGIEIKSYPINIKKICGEIEGLTLESIPLKSKGLRGIAVLSKDKSDDDIILLNSNRDACEQNFDCGHELYHVAFHRYAGNTFNCLENVKPCQNKFLEWQANEGSAELLVPYKLLLPEIKKSYCTLKSYQGIQNFIYKMSKKFNVTDSVISIRLDDLKYEIFQYVNGASLNDVKVLSDKRQKDDGIYCISLIDMREFYRKKEEKKHKFHYYNSCKADINIYRS